MERMFPETTESEAAMEGTAAHELAVPMIDAFTYGGLGWPKPDEVIGKQASNGVIWTLEMYQGAKMYAEECQSIMQSTGCFVPHVEQRVNIDRIYPGLFGTPDFWVFDKPKMTLHLPDFKFGHQLVDPFENYTLIEYTVGILDELEINGYDDQSVTIVFYIIQPRSYHRDGPVRRWEVKASDLRPLINILEEAEHKAASGDGPCVVGPECLHCSARRACETNQQAVYTMKDIIGQPIPTPLNNDELAIELRMVQDLYDIVKARKTGLEAQAEETIQQGGTVEGCAIEPGRGSKKWTVPASEVFALGDLMGVELRKPAEPITPTQAIAAGIDVSVIKDYSKTYPGKMKLIRSDQTLAHAIFTKRMK